MPARFPSPTSVPSVKCADWSPSTVGLERKQVSVLALSFRESRDRLPCIHPAHKCPLSPAAGDGCACRRGCIGAIRGSESTVPSGPLHHRRQCTARDCTRDQQICPGHKLTCVCCSPSLPSSPFQPALCPRLQILVRYDCWDPPPPSSRRSTYTHPSPMCTDT